MNIYINCMTGEQKIAATAPGALWSCLGAAYDDANIINNKQYQDVDMTVPDDFDEDDI